MSEVRPTYDDEIDLLEVFETLWDGKWLIITLVAFAVLVGAGSLLLKDAVYGSKLIYSVDTHPPFYTANKVTTDFQSKFYSASVFEEWKQNNRNTSLVFEDFSATEVVDGFVFSRDEDKQLATMESEKKVGSFVLVKSNRPPILEDFFKYTNHVNELLKKEYVFRAKEELKIISASFKNNGAVDVNIVDTGLSIDRYVAAAEKGANVLAIQRPTMPKKVSPNSSLTLALSAVLGGMVGVVFVLVSNAVRKRKESFAKA